MAAREYVHDELDLAWVADALLGLCAPDALAPCLTDEAWEIRRKRHGRRELQLDAHPGFELAAKVQDSLLAVQVREVIEAAGLTRTQDEVFTYRMLGHTFEEIGTARSTTKQAAMRVFAQGLRKVAASMAKYRFQGLSEAYAVEVARNGHKRRR